VLLLVVTNIDVNLFLFCSYILLFKYFMHHISALLDQDRMVGIFFMKQINIVYLILNGIGRGGQRVERKKKITINGCYDLSTDMIDQQLARSRKCRSNCSCYFRSETTYVQLVGRKVAIYIDLQSPNDIKIK
jgi:hypothetical protein